MASAHLAAERARRLREMARTSRVFTQVFGAREADAAACEAGAKALDLLPRLRRIIKRLRDTDLAGGEACACGPGGMCQLCEARAALGAIDGL